MGGFDLYSNGFIYSDCKKPINLFNSIPVIKCGANTRDLRDRPKLDSWMDENLLICISYKNGKKNLWLIFPDLYQLRLVST